MGNFVDFLDGDAEQVAPRLLGCELLSSINGLTARVKIVEVESYRQDDAASHSFRGQTARTATMFGPSGHAYVYFTYGMHYCLNVVTGEAGVGQGVLIRAVEPIEGVENLQINRQVSRLVDLTNGPAKLTKALGVNHDYNGHDLRKPPLQLVKRPVLKPDDIITTTRVGISRDIDRPWRFYIKNNPYVSKPWL